AAAARSLRGPRRGARPARALRTRGPPRTPDALRGLEPGDAGGDGARPRRGGHARRRHSRQGDGRRAGPAGRSRRPRGPGRRDRGAGRRSGAPRGPGRGRTLPRAIRVRLGRPHRAHACAVRGAAAGGTAVRRAAAWAAGLLAAALALIVITGRPTGVATAG